MSATGEARPGLSETASRQLAAAGHVLAAMEAEAAQKGRAIRLEVRVRLVGTDEQTELHSGWRPAPAAGGAQ